MDILSFLDIKGATKCERVAGNMKRSPGSGKKPLSDKE